MKILLFILYMAPVLVMGQNNQSNAAAAMKMFQQYYNSGQGDSINHMFGKSWDQMKSIKPIWTKERNAGLLEEYGNLESFKFIGIDRSDSQKVYVFQTIFSKGGEKTTSLTLDNEDKLSTFRFITTSRGISKLLNKYRQHNIK